MNITFLKYLLILITITSCSDNNRVDNITFEKDTDNKEYLKVCFSESFKYDNYIIKFEFETKSGYKFKDEAQVFGSSISAYISDGEKCRKIYTGAFLRKGMSDIEYSNLSKIKKDSIKLISVELKKTGDLISTNSFNY